MVAADLTKRCPLLLLLLLLLLLVNGMTFDALRGDNSVTFEALDGTMLLHQWGASGDSCRHLQGFRVVELTGTFTMTVAQGIDGAGGKIEDIDLIGNNEIEYHLSGEGSYGESRSSMSHTAAPPNFSATSLVLMVNDFPGVHLTIEPTDINDHVFPRMQFFVSQAFRGVMDCFELKVEARPTEPHARRFFRRGDVDGNGKRDISDPIAALNHLFAGASEPSCADAEDANDDGKLDVTDAIHVLNYLFRGQGLPPIPSTFCGLDPTEDDLDCRGQAGCMSEAT